MKLIPSRPVTVNSVRHGERWFPFVFRHTDGSLLMYVQFGHDRHFSPCQRLRSLDDGRTWIEEEENVPRLAWCHSFADGELFEIDTYGFVDPKAKETFVYYGAWSDPSRPMKPVQRGNVHIHAPSCISSPLTEFMSSAYPTYPWWPLYNGLHGKAELRGDEIFMGGTYLTSGVELPNGRLLAVGYQADTPGESIASVTSVYAFESRDRGHTWEEHALVARGVRSDTTPEGFTEVSIVPLKDSRLYCVMRTGRDLYGVWSSDGGTNWTKPKVIRLTDSDHIPGMAWPVCKKLEDGTLVLAYGRPGKHLIFDPTGTGENWQGHLNLHAWELETQAIMGVPEDQRLRGPTHLCVRYWDSGDYLAVVQLGAREVLVFYDVKHFLENWNADPISGVRMVKVRLE